jgi:hypothetical protein
MEIKLVLNLGLICIKYNNKMGEFYYLKVQYKLNSLSLAKLFIRKVFKNLFSFGYFYLYYTNLHPIVTTIMKSRNKKNSLFIFVFNVILVKLV